MVDGFTPAAHNIHANVLYFVSLTLALSVSSVCILGKQWIREYQKDLSVSPCDAVRVRQVRFDSLEAWNVPKIMTSLPVILLIALMLFFTGLLVQLWNLGDKSAATVVSIIVGFTVLLVITTTVVPAWVSTKHSRSAFAPFRSPQSWIFFYVFRRVQHWYHQDSFWQDHHPILSSWAEFDRHFLKIESNQWFDHKISSVHRALRWVFEVLRNSNEIEKSLLWSLQSKFHPKYLVKSEGQLGRHVLCSSEEGDGSDSLIDVYYVYSEQNEGRHSISSSTGRHQVELLVRLAHHAISHVPNDPQRSWDSISLLCERLLYHGIFDNHSRNTDVQQRT